MLLETRCSRIPPATGTTERQRIPSWRSIRGEREQRREGWQPAEFRGRTCGRRHPLSGRGRRPMRSFQPRSMRILAITNMYPSAAFPGRGVFVEEQVKGLRSIGLEVRVLFVDRREEGPLVYYRLRNKIGAAVAEFEPDVIHVMYGGVMADQIVRRHHARPVAVTFHGSDLL